MIFSPDRFIEIVSRVWWKQHDNGFADWYIAWVKSEMERQGSTTAIWRELYAAADRAAIRAKLVIPAGEE